MRNVSGEKRDPMTRSPVNVPDSRTSCRRAMNARRMMSPSSGHWLITCLRRSPEIANAWHSLSATAAKIAGVPVRVYRPLGAKPDAVLPTLAWFHGGGFVIGDLDTADPTARKLANRAECVVVSVDYRLAPENAFPAAPEDCWAVTAALTGGEAATYGGDPERVAVGGDSAGGNLAAVVAVRARDAADHVAGARGPVRGEARTVDPRQPAPAAKGNTTLTITPRPSARLSACAVAP